MFSMIALLVSMVVTPVSAPAACETVGPRLDGTTVTICGGSVVSVQDKAGNVNVRPFSSVR